MKKAVENNNTYEQIVNNNLDLLKNVSDSTKILVETLGANEKLVQQAQKLNFKLILGDLELQVLENQN